MTLFLLLVLGIAARAWAGPFETKLTASDATADDEFGAGVSISGNTAIVGARFDDDAGSDSGSAYLFTIPEPSTLTLAALVLVGLLARGRRTKTLPKPDLIYGAEPQIL